MEATQPVELARIQDISIDWWHESPGAVRSCVHEELEAAYDMGLVHCQARDEVPIDAVPTHVRTASYPAGGIDSDGRPMRETLRSWKRTWTIGSGGPGALRCPVLGCRGPITPAEARELVEALDATGPGWPSYIEKRGDDWLEAAGAHRVCYWKILALGDAPGVAEWRVVLRRIADFIGGR